MFSINSRVLRRILGVMCRVLSLSGSSPQAVTFERSANSATIRMAAGDVSIACRLPFPGKPLAFSIPLASLAGFHSSGRHDVTFHVGSERVGVRHWLFSQYQEEYFDLVEASHSPPPPEWLLSNPGRLGQALTEAASIAVAAEGRYALDSIQLRGAEGKVSATDGQQAYQAFGFNIPADDVLIAAKPLLSMSVLKKAAQVNLGRSSDWFSVEAVSLPLKWRVDLRILSERRFPNVDGCFPLLLSSSPQLVIDDHDADFLLRRLPEFLGPRQSPSVTLDRSAAEPSAACLRFRPSTEIAEEYSRAKIMELSLSDSQMSTSLMPIAFDPYHLLAALRFGFRTFAWSEKSSISSTSSDKRMVWASHSSELCEGHSHTGDVISTGQRSLAVV